MSRNSFRRWLAFGCVALAALAGALTWRGGGVGAASGDYRTALAVKGEFRQTVRRSGVLKPVKEQRIFTRVAGVIQEMAPQGSVVNKGDVVLKIDAGPHEDRQVLQQAQIVQMEAEFAKLQQEAAKILNQAKEDVQSYELKLELEQMRLDEIKKGASASDVINARVTLENATNLLKAKEDEMKVLEVLAAGGYASKEELRQKQLDVTEQRLQVEQAQIKNKRLNIIDPVKLADQDLKVKDAQKIRDAARERVILLERNMKRDQERHAQKMERERELLAALTDNVKRCIHRAPGPGLVVHRRSRWGAYAPGREVYDGQELMALPDFTSMKVSLTVDEARIAYVQVEQEAEIRPAGWTGAPLKGRVVFVAEKGRDEFEVFQDETIAITGTANRQVFDVEVEIVGSAENLRPGLRADVEIVQRSLKDVILLPRMALVRDKEGNPVVYVSGESTPRAVKVKAENETTAVVEGVKEGEPVLVVGHPR